ncbi:hypothetical protein VF10_32140, partial [Nostoc linckia z13]|uniref:hypothetical protein n=1 Tax=Nostoc linckia TaxID=92942 RepID=UPI000C0299B1
EDEEDGKEIFPLSLPGRMKKMEKKSFPSLSPHSRSILKTLLANYAIDKLKIEIAGNSHLAFPLLYSGKDCTLT